MPRPSKTQDNKLVKELLSNYCSLYEASLEYPFLDDIIHGASRLDLGGNTRPLSKGMLYNVLADVDNITTLSVGESIDNSAHAKITGRTQLSERHLQKIATALRIASTMIAKELAKRPTRRESYNNQYCFGSDELWPEENP